MPPWKNVTEMKKALGAALFLAIALLTPLAVNASVLELPLDFVKIGRDCLLQEQYSIGGAMIGDCYLDHAAALEVEIDNRLAKAIERFNDPMEGISFAEERERILEIQRLWLDYRDRYCGFIEEYPGNTPSYVNASACVLGLTQDRLLSMDFIDYATLPHRFE